MDLKSENLGREDVKELFLENEKRIMVLKSKATDNSDEIFERKMRVKLEENLINFPGDAVRLKKIIIDYPETYKGFVPARTYFEVAYNTISAECANLGFVCLDGCTLDFGTRVYTIHPNGSKVPVVVTSRCEVYVLPSREEPGKDFVQELSNAWAEIIKERFDIDREVQVHENLQTRIFREMQQQASLCENAEQLLAVLEEVKEVSERLANESVIFPEKLALAEKEFADVQRREKVVEVKEKFLSEKGKALAEKEAKLAEKGQYLSAKEKELEVKEQSLAEIQADLDRVDDEGYDPAD